ncbi:hypothetical protein [Caballeronia sp. LZ035]|uniref:hypothetical protein n=1 Tax=Caballeronia sp. LZ035 TaxID=3038568 RepID=UPI00285DF465|nr:hypothetical protein [Caballeronia sp. LZ035]MDR5760502.1 hypothetical protein [Caballeronia sp. LZ035]
MQEKNGVGMRACARLRRLTYKPCVVPEKCGTVRFEKKRPCAVKEPLQKPLSGSKKSAEGKTTGAPPAIAERPYFSIC